MSHIADRHLAFDVAHQRHRDLVGEGDVELAGDEGQDRRRAVGDDRVFDAIEIRQARFPVVRVARDLDALVGLVFDELERAGADRRLAHLCRRDMARVDRREARREQGQQRRLRRLEIEHRLVLAVRRHALDVGVPALAEVDLEVIRRRAGQQVPGAFHVGRGEGLAVVPFDAAAQREGQCFAVLAPLPALGEVGHDAVEAVLPLVLVEHDEVVEHPHHRQHHGDRAFFVDRHAGGAVAVGDAQDTALLLRPGGANRKGSRQE